MLKCKFAQYDKSQLLIRFLFVCLFQIFNDMKQTTLITNGKSYYYSDDEIQVGDLAYNEKADVVDKCIFTAKDGFNVFEFASGLRASIHKSHYKKVIPV